VPTSVVRKIYLYQDFSTTTHEDGAGGWRDRPADMPHILRFLDALPKDVDDTPNAYHAVDGGEAHVLLFVAHATDDFVAGLFGKKRVDGLPLLEEHGTLYRQPIPDAAGYFEACHFVYFAAERQLLLEVNQYSPRRSTFEKYITAKYEDDSEPALSNVFFRPVVGSGALAQFRRVAQDVSETDIVFKGDILRNTEYEGRLGDILLPLAKAFPNVPRIGLKFQSELFARHAIEGLGEFVVQLIEQQPETLASVVAWAPVNSGSTRRKLRFNLLSQDFGHPVTVPIVNRYVDSSVMWELMVGNYSLIREAAADAEQVVDVQVAVPQAP
jgi:hypothetical protein